MSIRLGLGPVFESEWLTGSRRWLPYATRALFVMSILFALGTSWGSSSRGARTIDQARALLAASTYYAIV